MTEETASRGAQPNGMAALRQLTPTRSLARAGAQFHQQATADAAQALDLAYGVGTAGPELVALGVRFYGGIKSLPSAVGKLGELVGPVYERYVARYGSQKFAESLLTKQATAVLVGRDSGGALRTIITTSNRAVWSHLVELRSAGKLADGDVIMWVDRAGNKAATHPDVVAARVGRGMGITKANFASIPETSGGCQAEIPAHVPRANIETPIKPK